MTTTIWGIGQTWWTIGIVLLGFGIFGLIYARNRKITPLQKKKILVYTSIGLAVIVSALIAYFTFPLFNAIGVLVNVGFLNIFSKGLNFTFFLAALFLMFIIFFYTGVFLFLWFLFNENINFRGSIPAVLAKASKKVFVERKKYIFVLLAITLSISLIHIGTLFLISAFPSETLITKGITGVEGSTLNCNSAYFNFIAGHDLSCDMNLSQKFNDKNFSYAYSVYYINRTEFKDNISNAGRKGVTLYFDEIKQPSFVRIRFNEGSEELFTINNVGVYTKEAYFDREKQKITWFYIIISFSIFSVFSAVSNLKNILS